MVTIPLDDLVDFMAATSGFVESSSPSRERIAIRFHHLHLPKMYAAGLVEYEYDERLVEPTEKVTVMMQYLTNERQLNAIVSQGGSTAYRGGGKPSIASSAATRILFMQIR